MNSTNRHQQKNLVLAAVVAAILLAAPAFGQVYLVEDINPGTGNSGEFVAGTLGSNILFKADDGTHGEELWVSDGTALGTSLVLDIWPVFESRLQLMVVFSSEPGDFTAAGATMYFTASAREDPVTHQADFELWLTDGPAPVPSTSGPERRRPARRTWWKWGVRSTFSLMTKPTDVSSTGRRVVRLRLSRTSSPTAMTLSSAQSCSPSISPTTGRATLSFFNLRRHHRIRAVDQRRHRWGHRPPQGHCLRIR